MRKIIVATFLSMDGVMQAPGGPQEDTSNGFKWGGWIVHYGDDLTNNAVGKIMSKPFDLLLGRRTYEIFAAHWPYQNDAIGEIFNRINKYVVATTPIDTSWKNSILINKDVVNELKKLKKQDGPDLLVHGSSKLVQTLFAHQLIDELHTWIYPITLGKGKKLFEEGTQAQEWKLTDSVVSTTGVIIASYVPGGDVKTGSFVPDQPSAAEMKRREKWRKEENKK
ncbi:MAG TPA: dihydrofolate reductase family protein [Chitinophagaceae bacterium]|nr:dihydrofolate reductase family protein [Chitinophagaceae bacterium]